MNRKILIALAGLQLFTVYAQTDSLPLKISHAEPLYIDLIRDLGARKGEKEFNAGWKLDDRAGYREQGGFIEYEFSPLNRLGLEMEIPFNYYYHEKANNTEDVPNSKIQAIKPALQYTFLVSKKHRLSMALGAIYEMELHSFKTMRHTGEWIKGHNVNPFFIIAKRLGRQFHMMLYTGPVWQPGRQQARYQTNLSFHYVIPRSKHFIGLEINQDCAGNSIETIMRPQVKLRFSNAVALGLVTGIPVNGDSENLSFLMRLIYEPAK